MDVGALRTQISASPLADVAACRVELAAITVARGLLDAREVEVVRRLDSFAAADAALFPQEVVATATRSSLGAAERLRDRAATASDVPELGAALEAGATTGDRVDVVARATAGLSAVERSALAGHGARLALAASTQTTGAFRKTVEEVVRRVRTDAGLAKLERQRRQARLRWWLDGEGMWNLAGKFDPVAGLRLEGRLRNEIERRRACGLPSDAPTDPIERQQYLAALALVGLLCPSEAAEFLSDETGEQDGHSADGTGDPAPGAPTGPTQTGPSSSGQTWPGPARAPSSGWPDVTVLIDARTFLTGEAHDDTISEAGIGRFGLPVATVRRWACLGSVTPVVIGADGVRLFLGRETRLANRAQRRALRVLYRTCALCDTAFEHCQIHHVHWYDHGGRTDIDDLIPLCNRHHHLAHEGGWQLHLAPDRTLTITRPGGHVTAHGPPRAHAA
ncbi:MAG: hypothetical protein WCC60_06810 [Ilumatobacteraceae bacterium]